MHEYGIPYSNCRYIFNLFNGKQIRRRGRVCFGLWRIYIIPGTCMDVYTLACTHNGEDLKLESGYGALYNKNVGNRILHLKLNFSGNGIWL